MELRSPHVIATALLLATAAAGLAASGSSRHEVDSPLATNRPTSFAAAGGRPVSFRGTLDRTAVLRGGDGVARVELVIAAPADPLAQVTRRPTDLVVVLDRSGSMSGEKIQQAREAVRHLVQELGAQDRFALVTYADDANISIDLSTVDGRAREVWGRAIDEVQANGGTNMSSGLDLGIDLVEGARGTGRVPHVILISDGLANGGDETPSGLTRRARRAAQGEYLLSTIGVGTDFNASLMHAIADAGTGNYYYLETSQDLGAVFAREFDAARSTVARGLAVQIDPGAGVRVVDAAGYPLDQLPNGSAVFRPGSLFSGQERRVWVTLAVPPGSLGEFDLGQFSLSYAGANAQETLRFTEHPRVASVASEREYYSGIDVDAWSRSVVVDGYNKMQEEVAKDVQEGRRDQAMVRLRQFKEQTAEMNAHLNSPPVAAQMDRVEKLEAEVDGAFVGDDQAMKQKRLSKAAGSAAIDARRAGSKK